MTEPKFIEEVVEKPVESATETVAPPPVEKPAPAVEMKKEATETPKAEPAKTEEARPQDPKEAAYWRGLADEREKRRQAERASAYWRGRAEASPHKETEEERKRAQQEREDRYLTDPVGSTEQITRQTVAEAVLQDRWARSIYMVESEHKDWPARRDAFLKMAAEDPSLEARANNHPFPAKFAYEFVRQREQVGSPLDVEAERKKLRAEIEADLRKEFALSAAGATPQTLAGASGAGGSGSVGQVPDVNDLFKDKSF